MDWIAKTNDGTRLSVEEMFISVQVPAPADAKGVVQTTPAAKEFTYSLSAPPMSSRWRPK
ncbi:hypothetical protein BGE01nite_32950 [Brevifollis gellanilyticus]|uniref:Uncharacterized protein n=1 Tax=Brevifollis gellanilyticus TaxID=748831 RepID=A0A512MB96_9BACT|nr:hypothetical protein BGE01nite_32950 [Brevifollis gellanilyticus]